MYVGGTHSRLLKAIVGVHSMHSWLSNARKTGSKTSRLEKSDMGANQFCWNKSRRKRITIGDYGGCDWVPYHVGHSLPKIMVALMTEGCSMASLEAPKGRGAPLNWTAQESGSHGYLQETLMVI